MSEIYENLSNASSGKELVDQINSLGLEAVIAELSETEAAAIVEKFNADPDFNKFVEEVTSNAVPAPVQGAPAPLPGSTPAPGTGIDFGRIVNAATGAELVSLLRDSDLGAITAGLSPEQIEQVVQKFGADNDFNAWLAPPPPPPPPPGMIAPGAPAAPGGFVPPPLPGGAELDRLITDAQNGGQGPLITDSKGQILNQFGEVMVLDSSGNLAPAPRDVPVSTLPDGNGNFMPDRNWVPPDLPPSYVPPGVEVPPGNVPPGMPPEAYYPPPPPPPDYVELVGQYVEPLSQPE